jgi:hypothetical protein
VDYLDASRIEDLELRQLWRDAQNALLKVDDFLKEKLGNDFFDGF